MAEVGVAFDGRRPTASATWTTWCLLKTINISDSALASFRHTVSVIIVANACANALCYNLGESEGVLVAAAVDTVKQHEKTMKSSSP